VTTKGQDMIMTMFKALHEERMGEDRERQGETGGGPLQEPNVCAMGHVSTI
jgi:hypothetical protein